LREGTTRIGRDPDNDIAIRGPEAATVSMRHLEIARIGTGFRIHDLGSTNGTYLNGEKVVEAELTAPAVIRLGANGPELNFVLEDVRRANLDQTLVVPEGVILPSPGQPSLPGAGDYDALLSQAVERARRARHTGAAGQTMSIMREALDDALRHTHGRFRKTIALLVILLVGTAVYGAWRIVGLKREKGAIDARIHEIERRLGAAGLAPDQADQLITELTAYQNEAERLRQDPFYRVGVRESESFVAREIRTLMAEFGAEVYSIPPDFVERVNHYIEQYQGPDRPLVAKALAGGASDLRIMQAVLKHEQLPPDLAYIPLVESALGSAQTSAAGAAGLWQFTAATAKAYGLRVDEQVDERLDLEKSTRAGCRYLRELILDFGSGSSVMLALAAYNLGPAKVKQAVMRTVRDPIKQRNFWYLYRAHALPEETRQYVPRVMAAMIVGRNPNRYGID
jgi:pSer/pThr/pTyr-binding forkhead associated (FHA) protein/soluble lytic murein transglycosylase-like protein